MAKKGGKPSGGLNFPKPKVGALLLAEPFNPHSYFKRAVVLLSQHDKTGSIGFVLNKPTEIKIHQAIDDFPEFDSFIHWGGDQHLDSIYYVHRRPDLKKSHEIIPGIFWGGNFEQLKLLIETKQIQPADIKFIAGYVAWKPRELAKEIKGQNWWVANGDPNAVFSEPPASAWGNILQRTGHVYGIMNDFPEDPSIN